jgi:AcrR family transcriptional regulator
MDLALIPVRERASTTERQLVDAATSCIRRYGIRRTSLEEVARIAGVSRGTVYRYYRSKDELIAAALSGAFSTFVNETRAVLEAHDTLADQVAANARLVRDYHRRDALLTLDETEPATVALLLTRDARPMFERWIEFWTPWFIRARDNGEVRPDLDIPRAIEWMLRLLMSIATTPSVTFDINDDEQLNAFVVDHLVIGFKEGLDGQSRVSGARR